MNNQNGKSTESWSVQRKPRLNVKKDGTTDLYVVDGEGKDIVWCGWESKVPFNGICCFPPNVAEKAALIAAAPEMLKMLKHIIDKLPVLSDGILDLDADEDDPERIVAELVVMANGVVARARSGKSD